MPEIILNIIRLPHAEELPVPAYESAAAAGMDLRAACDENQSITLAPCERALIPTGFIYEIPDGFEAQVRPRSGMAYKNGITCLNSPGTIDSDYRGEVKVLLINHSRENFVIKRADRIAQLVIAPVTRVIPKLASEISSTQRGAGGFGSTGV